MRCLVDDMIGKRYGRLLVLGRAENMPCGKLRVETLCDCGTRRAIGCERIRRGHTRSCGCLSREVASVVNATHGQARTKKQTPEYRTWCAMIDRCYRVAGAAYKNYGARGIGVCDRWRHSFELFFADMGRRPPGTSIDRIDNDGNYEPGNCRWATEAQQGRNRRNNTRITIEGETLCITDWSARSGVTVRAIRERLQCGITGSDLLHSGRLPYLRSRRVGDRAVKHGEFRSEDEARAKWKEMFVSVGGGK